jgi:hypothetical protein
MPVEKQPANLKRRKGWNQLSESYRKRLERAGINEKAYTNGSSLSDARGHRNTPERPERAYKGTKTSRYAEYRQKRRERDLGGQLGRKTKAHYITEAIVYTQRTIGHLPHYNHSTVINLAEKKTIAQLKRTVTMDADSLRAEARPQYPTNPWWYH